MELTLNILIGIGLAATCGFRIFIPLLVMGMANKVGYLELSQGFAWIGSYPALVIFGIATVVEIAAYFIPFVDNLLNTISVPFSIVAGIVVTAAVITDISPILKWTLAIIAGGGAASVTSLISNGAHNTSTFFSAGIANPIVSVGETVISVIIAVLSILVPIVVVILIIIMMVLVYRMIRRFKERKLKHMKLD
ncbi:MAG: Uncharacterized protein XD91_1402 [Clostridiales bacterium 38_11]|nr:MAG: Uncharacterized protein XD91_1402 [Clostridiales bacterium 38_11]HBH12835.1 DUF4126 domain-containing protein [Clostridiales bacterium]